MVIDKANAFILHDAGQDASNVLNFGIGDKGGSGNYAGFVNYVFTGTAGSVKLQDSADGDTYADLTGTSHTFAAAGIVSILLPAHKQYVKAVITADGYDDIDYDNIDVFLNADASLDTMSDIVTA